MGGSAVVGGEGGKGAAVRLLRMGGIRGIWGGERGAHSKATENDGGVCVWVGGPL